MIRLFVALELPDDLRLRLASLAAGIRGARWVPPENLHVTLRYLGEVAEDRTADVVDALEAIRTPAMPVTLEGAGHFSNGKRIRAVWIGVRRTTELAALHGRIERAVTGCGFEPERRNFMPHVTIGRLTRPPPGQVRSWLEANGGFAAAPFETAGFVLYESRPGGSGSAYLPLAEFAFAPAPL